MVAGEVAADGWAGSNPVVPGTGRTALAAIVPKCFRDERDAVYAGLERAEAAVPSREENVGMTDPSDSPAEAPGPAKAPGPAEAPGPAKAPGPAEAPTEPVPITGAGPAAQPAPPTDPSSVAPPPPSYAPPPVRPSYWDDPPQARSGPGPAPGYVYVGFWRRFAATLIDSVLFLFLFGILAAVFFSRIDRNTFLILSQIDSVTRQPVAPTAEILRASTALFGLWLQLAAVYLLAHLLYHVVFWSWRGGTLGQLALGIQVRRESDGRRIGIGTAVLRYIGYVISAWILYIGLIWAAFDRRKQGWHDKIAGTVVIRRVN